MEIEHALSLQVRFVDESALWSWSIRDVARQVLRDGWLDEGAAYRSRDRACAAGLERLDELQGGGDEESLVERLEACQLVHTDREVLGCAG